MSELIDWNALTPAQRNALIHEKVMGEPVQVPCTGSITWYPDPINKTPHGHWICSLGHSGYISDANYTGSAENHVRYVPIECYSESMDAAWLIVESEKFMRVNLEYDQMSWRSEKERNKIYDCIIHLYGGPVISAYDATMPEAICIAALRATGIEVQQET